MRRSAAWLLVMGVLLVAPHAGAKDAKKSAGAAKPPAEAAKAPEPQLEPKAIEILKAACARLAGARSMSFTAVVSYENPSVLGPPLVYTTKSEVLMQRPDKLRVITPGDGPASEFYYDGKTMVAFEPASNLAASAPAPPTIDAALKAAYDSAAIYFPFSDVVVADPYTDIAEGLKVAFYIGQSDVVGGTKTDMIAYVNDDVFVQAWIGVDDKLPRMLRAVFRNDPARLRHALLLTDWKLDPKVPSDAFVSTKAASATKIAFARPDPITPPGEGPPPTAPPSKPSKAKTKAH